MKKKDPAGRAIMAAAIVAIVLLLVAVTFVFLLQAPTGLS
jgi:hypothetical protein